MPSLPDTAVIIFLGLLLFGPKGLAQIARQLGKLMGEFRRASNEFRMQMEEELRMSEQADRQKEIAAIEAAAPMTPPLPSATTETPATAEIPATEHGETIVSYDSTQSDSIQSDDYPGHSIAAAEPIPASEPLPIATSGELNIMPPPTGLPAGRSSSVASFIDTVPKVDGPGGSSANEAEPSSIAHLGEDQKPMRYTNHHAESATNGTEHSAVHSTAAEESLHG